MKTTFILKSLIGIFFIVLAYGSEDSKDEPKINLDSKKEVVSYIQGKWHFKDYDSELDFRLLIKENEMTIWTNIEGTSWEMDKPEAEHSFSIGDKTRNIDKRDCRHLYFDDVSLVLNNIGGLQVVEKGIMRAGASYYAKKGW